MKITPKKRATKGKKIIVTIEFANWMSNGAKESLLLRVNDKMTRDTRATCVMRISTHRGTARYFYFSLSLSLFPFRTSVRWWKRGLYCALCSLLKYSRDDCSRRKRNFWLKNGIASRETPLSSVPLNNELQTSASRGESVKNARDEIFLSFLFLFSLFPPPFFFLFFDSVASRNERAFFPTTARRV